MALTMSVEERLAASVENAIRRATAPLLERLAAAEARLATLPTTEKALTELRDRVVIAETKAAAPVPSAPDLTPVMERLADLRDRVVTVETKVATPVLPLPPDAGVSDLRDRLVTLETKAAMPVPTVLDTPMVDLRERVASLERRVQDDSLAKELGSLRERVAVVEVRPPVPGPPGEPGPPGKDGLNGKDGTAGLTYQGVYQEAKYYVVGDVVTYAGSTWHANEETMTKPGDGSKAWTLMVKRGRDGRDGHDAPGALPVVSVGRTQ